MYSDWSWGLRSRHSSLPSAPSYLIPSSLVSFLDAALNKKDKEGSAAKERRPVAEHRLSVGVEGHSPAPRRTD